MKLPGFVRTISSAIVCIVVFSASSVLCADPIFESGTFSKNQIYATDWNTAVFTETYSAPPVVIMGPLSSNNTQPATVRVRNVTATGFEWQIDEFEYEDGYHGTEQVSYFVMEEGVHDVGGLIFEVGRTNVSSGNTTVSLDSSHTVAPAVFPQVESDNNTVVANDTIALIPRVRYVDAGEFLIQLQDQELNTGSFPAESVGYIAITPGQGTLRSRPFEATVTGILYNHKLKTINFGPISGAEVFVSQQTRKGGDPAHFRYNQMTDSSVGIYLEEEQSKNSEQRHNKEAAGVFVIGQPFNETESKLDIFTLEVTDTWQTVNLPYTYTSPIIVAGPPSQNDGDPATIRVRNVTPTSFQVQIDEWDYLDGTHASESVSMIVIEAGSYSMGGLQWDAGVVSGVTDASTSGTFASSFGSAPVVLGQVATRAGAEAVAHRFSNISGSGFSVELDEEDGNDGTHSAEAVHYIALEKGLGTFETVGGLNYAVAATSNQITDADAVINFGANYAAPVFVADLQTKFDGDPAALRVKSLSAGSVTLIVEEEESVSSDVSHTIESVGYFVAASVVDSDDDGLGDAWESLNGLDPNNPNDAGLDPDGDLFTNLEEFEAGLDPNVFNGGTVDLVDGVQDAYELEGTRARVQVRRTAGKAAITVDFTVDGGADADVASDASDYVATNAAGDPLNGSILIPANAGSADIYIDPVADSIFEYPEAFRVILSAGATYTISGGNKAGTISDATNDPANDKLYVGLHQAEPIAVGLTSGSGVATLLVNGTNTQARGSNSFGGLSSPQTVAHIHQANSAAGGPIVIGVPNGQYEDDIWNIVASTGTTGQDLIDKLNKQNGLFLYLNVHSTQFTSGEIRAIFGLAEGGVFDTPAVPPAITPLTGDDLTRDVARFLTQSTYGPTAAEITALADDITTNHAGDRMAGFNQWIDDQYALDQTNLYDYTYFADQQEWSLRGSDPLNSVNSNDPDHNNRRRGWWTIAMKSHDQLRQRVGFALSEIFIISEAATQVRTRHYGAAKYYDLVVGHSNGTFRSLIEEVSKSPMMGYYLSSLKNQKSILDPVTGDILVAPDENYAREIMQLFSVGLLQMNPDGTLELNGQGLPIQTYTNVDITALARVFTGWSFSKRVGSKADGYPTIDNSSFNLGNGPKYFQPNWENPMKNFAVYHDTDAKTFLGGMVSAGLDGEADLDAALDIIAGHSNVGPFLARRMIQRLTNSNPSRGYIYRVSQAFESGTYNGSGSGQSGDFAAMTKAILLDYEARTLSLSDDISYGKQKEPLLRYVQLIRALDGKSQILLSDMGNFGYPATQLDNFPVDATRYRYGDTTTILSQSPLDAPSVFNWFLPDYEPGGDISASGLFAPEMIQTTETQTISNINYMRTLTYGGNGQGVNALVGATDGNEDNVQIDKPGLQALYDAEITGGATVAEAVETLIDHLDVVLMAGNFKATYGAAPAPNPRSTVIDTIIAAGNGEKIRGSIYLLCITPEYIHQK